METKLINYKSLPTSSGIYHVLNSQNGKFYVGSAKNLRKRLRNHYSGTDSNPHLQKAINKYGKESFTVEVEVWDNLSNKELFEIEQWYLDIYYSNCWELTYNIALIAGGGDIYSCLSKDRQREFRQKISGENHPMFGKKHSDDSKQKMSEVRKGEKNHMFGKKHSDRTKRKLSEIMEGKNHPFYGQKHTEETKQKMSEIKKGHTHSLESKQKMSEAQRGEKHRMFGKEHSDNTKQKMSEIKKGESNPFFGKEHSSDTKQKMSEARYRNKILKGVRVVTDYFCCYCPNDAQKELKIQHQKFHQLYKINEDTGYYSCIPVKEDGTDHRKWIGDRMTDLH